MNDQKANNQSQYDVGKQVEGSPSVRGPCQGAHCEIGLNKLNNINSGKSDGDLHVENTRRGHRGQKQQKQKCSDSPRDGVKLKGLCDHCCCSKTLQGCKHTEEASSF